MGTTTSLHTQPGTRAAILCATACAAPWLRGVTIYEDHLRVHVQLHRPWWARLVAWAVPRYQRTRVVAAVAQALEAVRPACIRYTVTADVFKRRPMPGR